MFGRLSSGLWLGVVLLSVLLVRNAAIDWDVETDLDRYVHSDDGYFTWEVEGFYEYERVTVYFVNFTSQKWMDETFSNRPIWFHRLMIAVPDEILYPDTAVMAIGGGTNKIDEELPPKFGGESIALAVIANQTKCITGYLKKVPNQPIVFVDDPEQKERTEDRIIAYTWRRYFLTNTSIPEMVLRMPMTKSAKRGLDAMNEFIFNLTGSNVTKFAVGGASKRGWTTWSIAATDRRVKVIAPLVMSLLNFPPTLMQHHRNMDGAWSFALAPYYEEDLTYFLLAPIAEELWKIEDPFTYKERLDLPKFVISGTGDEFFLLDDSHHWFSQMPGQKWLMMNPNADHTLFPQYVPITKNVISTLNMWNEGLPLYNMTWSFERFEGGGTVTAFTDTIPDNVTAFEAVSSSNNTRRDFRSFGYVGEDIGFQGIVFRKADVEMIDDYTYSYTSQEVDGLWVASFIEVQFTTVLGEFLQLTTEVLIVPDTYPAEPCEGPLQCHGELV